MKKELEWYTSCGAEIEKFRGRHIAILGNKVIASGDSAVEVWRQARKKFPNEKPVMAFVPKKEAMILIVIK